MRKGIQVSSSIAMLFQHKTGRRSTYYTLQLCQYPTLRDMVSSSLQKGGTVAIAAKSRDADALALASEGLVGSLPHGVLA